MKDHPFLNEIIAIIRANLFNENFRLEDIWQHVCMSKASFYRKYDEIEGLNMKLKELVYYHRLKKAAELLRQTDEPISQVGFLLCFRNAGHFSRRFSAQFGITPREYRKKYR